VQNRAWQRRCSVLQPASFWPEWCCVGELERLKFSVLVLNLVYVIIKIYRRLQ